MHCMLKHMSIKTHEHLTAFLLEPIVIQAILFLDGFPLFFAFPVETEGVSISDIERLIGFLVSRFRDVVLIELQKSGYG